MTSAVSHAIRLRFARSIAFLSGSAIALILILAAGCNRSESPTPQGNGADIPETVVLRPSRENDQSGQQPAQPAESSEDTARSQGETPGASGSGTITIGSNLALDVPENWQSQQPAISMIEHEYRIPAVESDDAEGRATFMSAGGSVQANIDRWFAQFTQPDGSDTAEKATVEERTIAGMTVHTVDVSGTFNESMGPMMASTTPRPGYRMLAAIIETGSGLYFIKFYGPEKTVTANAEAFHSMLESLRAR